MLSYWILRRADGRPAGLIRVQNDRVLLHLSAPVTGEFTLLSATEHTRILPETETRFPCAEALLGTENGETTCFAAAQDAAPLACYRERLSRIYTKWPEPPIPPAPKPEPSQNSTIEERETEAIAQDSEEQSQINTIEQEKPDTVDDTARETESFSLLLNRAEAFYAAYEGTEDMVQKEDNMGGIDLFPQRFPGARWRYVTGADVLPHYEGSWTQRDGGAVRILAVPGRAAPRPPRQLSGFTRFLRDPDGNGYWVKLLPAGN